jgi:hypothetical protein
MRRTFSALATALLLQAGLVAQDIPKPAPEMSQIAFFEGNWTCQGKMMESPLGPAGEGQSTVEVKKDLGNFFQTGVVKGTMKGMPPFEGRFQVTYDPAAKQFVQFWVDNMGGWAQSTTSGWKGDTLVFAGDSHMGPQTFRSRDTFTRSGAGTMKRVGEVEIKGKWMVIGEDNCKKK